MTSLYRIEWPTNRNRVRGWNRRETLIRKYRYMSIVCCSVLILFYFSYEYNTTTSTKKSSIFTHLLLSLLKTINDCDWHNCVDKLLIHWSVLALRIAQCTYYEYCAIILFKRDQPYAPFYILSQLELNRRELADCSHNHKTFQCNRLTLEIMNSNNFAQTSHITKSKWKVDWILFSARNWYFIIPIFSELTYMRLVRIN